MRRVRRVKAKRSLAMNGLRRHWVLLGATSLIVLGLANALAAANVVGPSSSGGRFKGLGATALSVTDLVPWDCRNMPLTSIYLVGTVRTNAAANELILGTAGNDTINGDNNGGTSQDCILGGAGNDTINGDFPTGGGGGNDVILGGPGDDTLNGNRGSDIVMGGTGKDIVSGGGGGDTLYAGDASGDTVDGETLNGNGAGDVCYGNTAALPNPPTDTFNSCETIVPQ